MSKKKRTSPRVLFLDIETRPILAHVWALWDQNVGLNQIESDWSILSFAAKWADEPKSKIIYKDLSKARDFENDLPLLRALWKLLDEADIVVTQNGISFDKKKIYARFILNGMQPPSTFKMIDTKVIAKSTFGFTSNRLEYMSDKINTKYKKLKHEKFHGHELWTQCLRGNPEAWKEMAKYNKYDVLALEELYTKLLPWMSKIPNFNLYTDEIGHVCRCGSREFHKRGFHYTAVSKYQCYRCKKCGAETRDRKNLFSQDKRDSLHVGVPK